MNGQVNFYTNKIMLQVKKASDQSLAAIAHRIEERAKNNVVDNDQIDTGAMLNGIYVVTAEGTDYSQARAAAEARNPDAQMGSQVSLGNAGAAVVAGMEYSIYQEMQRSFLYKAAEDTAKEVDGLIKQIKD